MSLFDGVDCFVRGCKIANSRQMRKFVAIPVAISFVLVVAGLWIAFAYVSELASYLAGLLPGFLGFLAWIIEPALYLFCFLIGAWTFGFAATIVASPFLGELSKQVEISTARVVLDFVERPWWQQILPALAREARKLLYHLPRIALLLLVSITPVVNVFAPFAWLGFGAWMTAAQFCDYANENRDKPFKDTLRQLRRHRLAALGFGGCATFAMAIPLLNFLVVPMAVAGGTLLAQHMRASEPGRT